MYFADEYCYTVTFTYIIILHSLKFYNEFNILVKAYYKL